MRRTFIGACCLVLAACGGREQTNSGTPGAAGGTGSPDGGSLVPPVPLERDRLLTELASAFCDNISSCCQQSGIPYDAAICKKAAEASMSTWFQAITPSASYDPAAAGWCRDAIAAAVGGCGDPQESLALRSCYDIFAGTQAPGGPCTNNGDCAHPDGRGATCLITVLANTTGSSDLGGHCNVVQLHGQLGDTCNGNCPLNSTSCFDTDPSSKACYLEDGLYCTFESNVGTCQRPAKLGEPCRNGACVEGTVCERSVCAAKRDTGSCTDALDACTATSYCSMNPPGPNGTISFQCLPRHADGTNCLGPDHCLSGICDFSASTTDAGGIDEPVPGSCTKKKSFVSPATCAGLFK